MAEDAPDTERTPQADLEYLVGVGTTPVTLERCVGLAKLVLSGLDVHGPLRRGQTGMLLYTVLSDVVNEQREEAFQRRAEFTSRLAVKTTCCQVAAAGELLRLTDYDLFEQFKDYRVGQIEDDSWQQLLDKKDNQGPTALIQLRASLWLWLRSAKGGQRWQGDMLKMLESAIAVYLAADSDRRERLRTEALSYLEPSKLENPMAVASDTPARATAEFPASPQPPAVPVRPPSPSVPDNLRPWLADLAARLRRQLESEQNQDKVSSPIAIPVRWSLTEQYPADQQINIWDESNHSSSTVETGTADDVAGLLASVPSGRLVILGKGGAGKTVLVRELALALLEQPDGPVPVIFRLSSWNPNQASLQAWMIAQLIEAYPALRKKVRDTQGRRTVAAILVHGRYILPILDGLDEVAPSHRATALRSINGALRRDDRLVLTSRPMEYVEAVNNAEGGSVIANAAVIELRDLTVDDLAAYLPRTIFDVERQAKWASVLEQLSETGQAGASALREALTTPLMAMLARAIYSDTHANPAELLDADRFPTNAAVANHLLDAFIRTRFADFPQDTEVQQSHRQWHPDDASRWLGLLATVLFAQGAREFKWWRLRATLFIRLSAALLSLPIVVGIGSFLTVEFRQGTADFLRDPALSVHQPGLALIFSCVMLIILGGAIGNIAVPRAFPAWRQRTFKRSSPRKFDDVLIELFMSFAYLAFVGTVIVPAKQMGLYPFDHPFSLPAVSFSASLILYILSSVMFAHGRVDETAPPLLLRHDLAASVIRAVAYGAAVSALFSVIWITVQPFDWSVPLAIFMAGFLAAVLGSASGQWYMRGIAMSIVGMPPWSFMTFLSDAHAQGVLQQRGGSYEFRHALLQERLAVNFAETYADNRILRSTLREARPDLLMAQLESGLVDEADQELRPLLAQDRLLVWPYLIKALQQVGKTDEAVQEARLLCEHTKKVRWRSLQRTYYDSCLILADLLEERGDVAEAEEVYANLLDLTKTRKVVGLGLADLQEARTEPMLTLRHVWINGSDLSNELRNKLDMVRQLNAQGVNQAR